MRCLFLVLAIPACAQVAPIPRSVPQGGVLRLHVPATAVSARMDNRTIRLFPQATGEALGLMPIPATEKPGDYTLELLDQHNAPVTTATVSVRDAHFRKQNVVIQPNVAELKPAAGESEDSAKFRDTVSDVRYWSEPLLAPVRGCMTSPYGVQRYLNGKPTGDIHAGLDLRAHPGTPVRAAAGGIVKLVRDWSLHGRTVAIDHGQGLETMYLHLSKFAVAEGDTVKKGDIIGYSGSTGRSNAPHLHWTVYVNGVPVNPQGWVKIPPCAAPPAHKK